jgi:hypothetical protein
MPEYPEELLNLGVEPDSFAGGRFTTDAAVAIATGEYGEGDDALAEKVIRESVGEWLLEDEPRLGRPQAVGGSAGRGAAGWAAVAHWLADAIANNVVDIAVGAALAKTLGRLREWRKQREGEGKHGGIEISRGAAALVAAADVASEFGERGPLEVEAVEEPSSVAGRPVSELSYVGVEPWIVFLRNVEQEVRYIVVVNPDGVVAGRLRLPFLEFEGMFRAESTFKD